MQDSRRGYQVMCRTL